MKITDYPEAMELATNDVFIIDNPDNGTRHIPQSKLPWGEGGGSVPATEPAWVSHRNTYRGKSLGTVFTDEQKAAIADGSFNDLYIGDYWTIGNFDWVIADINYWFDSGSYQNFTLSDVCETNHVVVIPKTILYKYVMNDTLSNSSGYAGSKMRSQGLNTAKSIIYTAFNENNILSHNTYISNSVNNDVPTSYIWTISNVDLMSINMIVGTNNNNYNIYDINQLSLFRLNPTFFHKEDLFWTRDIPFNDSLKGQRFSIIAPGSYLATNPVRPKTGSTPF